ncbi:E1 [Equus caballus papillomavirus 5]|uniref:Replication protein E1 n=1 Tax=Equus caballus papillomavirus 5 TaxID=1235429 RepID=K9M9T0_9PAPI|nr:E1 [Equus caballus papillomavirus 5]AFS89111.1 E1 [Equus caballus papillomavirus 5]
MDPKPGTSTSGDYVDGAYFLDREAVCSSSDSDEAPEVTMDGPDAEAVDLIDNAAVGQGNSRSLFHRLQTEEDELQLSLLKRRFMPSELKEKVAVDLSPTSVTSWSPGASAAKRRLFGPGEQDSGLGTCSNHEAPSPHLPPLAQVHRTPPPAQRTPDRGILKERNGGAGQGGGGYADILRACNRRAAMLARFKDSFTVPFTELTRNFKSDKTCCWDWVICMYGVREMYLEAAYERLQTLCEYYQVTYRPEARGSIVLVLARFQAQKSRETVINNFKQVFNILPLQMIADPPRLRSTPAAIFWFRNGLSNCAKSWGPTPEWLKKQTMVGHAVDEDASKFDFSSLVQWAFDLGLTDEAKIAYGYARIADIDSNAAAWLGCANQAKYVKDAAQMVRYYQKARMQEMSMSAWVQFRSEQVDEGDWRPIVRYLKYQEIDMVAFLSALKHWLKGIPKKNTLVFWGPPDTGKSKFALSLTDFLGGKVISFFNNRTHFWTMPLADCKMACLDDATGPVWDYFDQFFRNALDGNVVSLDLKFRAPVQMRCPPLVMTTNLDVCSLDRYRYLKSRLTCFKLPNPFLFDENGNPVYELTVANWNSFFKRLRTRLELTQQEEEEAGDDGETTRPFRCSYRKTNDFA